jgi:putative sterol carrier protein
MINNQLNSTLAFTTGKLKIEGDIGKASELSKLFKEA